MIYPANRERTERIFFLDEDTRQTRTPITGKQKKMRNQSLDDIRVQAVAPIQAVAPMDPELIQMAEKSRQQRDKEQAEKLRDLNVVREGKSLVVPDGIDFDTAIRALILQKEAEEKIVAIDITTSLEVADGFVAFLRVLQREYGFVSNMGTDGFFFFPGTPPTSLSIETSPGHRETIPTGKIQVPGIDGWITPAVGIQNKFPVFKIGGEVKGKHKDAVNALAKMIEEECKKNSVYKGRAISTSFRLPNECANLQDTFPQFAAIDQVAPNQVVFSREIEEQIETTLYVPITHTELCRKHGIPLKRGVLLEGPYGTGKTLTAQAVATLCSQNGWTFIYLKDVRRLEHAYEFAAKYQPAVVFAEDMDHIINGEDEDEVAETLKNIRNAMDGIDSKGIEVMTVLTTNFLEKLTEALLRPGRIDTVVPVRAPDREASLRLVKMYARDLLDPNCDLENSQVGDILAGEIPAIIREVVERSKLSAIRRGGERLIITAKDLEVVARGMKNHMELLRKKEPEQRSDVELAAEILAKSIRESRTADPATHSFVTDAVAATQVAVNS